MPALWFGENLDPNGGVVEARHYPVLVGGKRQRHLGGVGQCDAGDLLRAADSRQEQSQEPDS